PLHAAFDQRLLHLDVAAHHAVLTDLEPLAVQDVAFDLAFDTQRAGHHHRAAKAGSHSDHGIGRRLRLRRTGAAVQEFHSAPSVAFWPWLLAVALRMAVSRGSAPWPVPWLDQTKVVRRARGSLENAPCLEQPLEVFLAVELEFHFAALAPGRDHDAGAESLL